MTGLRNYRCKWRADGGFNLCGDQRNSESGEGVPLDETVGYSSCGRTKCEISEYANSDNSTLPTFREPSIPPADERFLGVFAPSPDGTFRESKWFLRAGARSMRDARNLSRRAEGVRLSTQRGRSSQRQISQVHERLGGTTSHLSRGAQKNFADFASLVGKAWDTQADEFNEAYFRHLVAKAIVFRSTEDLVTKQPWYEGGYRANIVAYAIAKLAHDVEQSRQAVNFEAIWRAQGISSAMQDALTLSAKDVTQVLISPPAGLKNVTEWAKQQACWTRVASLKIAWPASWLIELLSDEEQKGAAKAAVREQKVLNGIEAQLAVVRAGARFWKEVKRWASENGCLTSKELQIIDVAASMSRTPPTEKQSIVIMKALHKARAEGCPFSVDAA